MSHPFPTCFAPPDRKEIKQVRTEHERIYAIPHLQKLLNAFPTPAAILNECRQIVAANQRLCALLNRRQDELMGMRPGEAFNCIHWREGGGGCGTPQFCATCGAVRATPGSRRQGGEDIQERTITMWTDEGEKALDLRVTASSFKLDGKFTVFSIDDISDEKRRAVLERMFFHDLLNTAAGVRNLLEVLPELSDQCRDEATHQAHQLVDYLIDEIEGGRVLAAAERGDLGVQVASVDVQELLDSVCKLYANHPVSQGKGVVVMEISGPSLITTDKLLLRRVLGNLVKNALEASVEGEEIRLGFQNNGSAIFRVHNERAMPEEVRLQVFRRSFSTKSPIGRGIGTYSAKLITERYLGGSLSFSSSEEQGTTFAVTLPVQKSA
jgi:signal transduction histidine kinase